MRLTELEPRVSSDPKPGCDGSFLFLCPTCRRGLISVWVVIGKQREGVHAHAVNAWPPDWDTISITPSIAAESGCSRSNRGCPGWHGFITNGEVR